jgi:hypothetical protein
MPDMDRGATPVIGNLLLVGVVVIVGVTVAVLSLGLIDGFGAPTAEASFSYEQTPVGIEMTPQALDTDVAVLLNGNEVARIPATAAGDPISVPTAPGDRISVVSTDGEQSVLVQRTVDDRSEVGNLIAYYPFENDGPDDRLIDQSGNGNDGQLQGTPTWEAGGLRFDGTGSSGNDYVTVTDLSSPVDVSAFTVAVAYTPETGAEKQELLEHIDGSSNWVLELKSENADEYELAYSVDKAGGSQSGQFRVGPYDAGDRQVAVGTFDGRTYELYVEGQAVGNDSFASEQTISMGDLYIGRDAEGSRDYFNGTISEVRLYYSALDSGEVRAVTNAMS